jgi:lipoprotein-anchoring transpeptidase ErfK/SrfK
MMSRPTPPSFPRAFLAAALLAAAPAFAKTEPPAEPAAPAPQPNVARQLRINVAWQIALESADFSPGILDGVFKRKSLMALNDCAARLFPQASPATDPKIYEALFNTLKVDVDNAFAPYTITADDAAQVGGPLPDNWNEKAQLKRLNYESLADCITEKFHATRGLLEMLNPGVQFDALEPGRTLWVPNIHPFPTDNRVVVIKRATNTGGVTVNLGEKTIRVFDKEGNELALFHCSIARDKGKLPDRDTKVQNIAAPNPNYLFNPKVWPEVHNVPRTLIIPPGPRNPVGLAWVSLDLPGYGIHGTPKPELIGKTGSHGCFRLTNWDALKFAGFVKEGMEVKIVNPEKETPPANSDEH